MVESGTLNAESAAHWVAPNATTLASKGLVKTLETMRSIAHIYARLIVDLMRRDEVILVGQDVLAGFVKHVIPGTWSDAFPLLQHQLWNMLLKNV